MLVSVTKVPMLNEEAKRRRNLTHLRTTLKGDVMRHTERKGNEYLGGVNILMVVSDTKNSCMNRKKQRDGATLHT